MLSIIMPKTSIALLDRPLIFLLGPIRGAPPWHDEAIDIFLRKHYEGFIVNPSRTLAERHEPYQAKGDDNFFPRQRAWERHYLDTTRKRARQGAIMGYLPAETNHRCEKSYGAMSRLELGQLMTHHHYEPSDRLCIGTPAEPAEQMSELNTIMYDLSLDMPTLILQQGLEATCDETLRIISRNTP